MALIPLPPAPTLPAPIRGRYVAHLRFAFDGTASRGTDLVRPLRHLAPVLLDGLGVVPYAQSGRIHNDPTAPAAYHSTNHLLDRLDDDAIEIVIDVAGPAAEVPAVVEIRHLGGALADRGYNAIGHREAAYLLGVLHRLDPPDLQTVRPVHAAVAAGLGRRSLGTSLNFLYGEEAGVHGVRRAFEPADYARLRSLKRTYDPGNRFRFNHNTPPAR